MKKVFVMAATLLMGASLWAQGVVATKSETIKDFKMGGFLGSDAENYYLWKSTADGTLEVCAMDKDLKMDNKHEVVKGTFNPDHTFMNENRLVMVSTLASETQVLKANKERRKAEVVEIDHAKGYWKGCETRYALHDVSANGQRYGVASFSMNDLRNKMASKVMVMDNEMKELWHYDGTELPSKAMMVTDFGEVVLGGYSIDANGVQTVKLALLSGQSQRSFEMTLPEIVLNDIEILNFQNGRILCSGAIQTPDKKVQNHKSMVGICTWVYDVNSNTMGEVNRMDFSETDLEMLYNGKASRKTFEAMAPNLECHCVVMPDGGVMVTYGLEYYEKEVDGDSTIYVYSNTGALTWRLDAQGKTLWHNGFYKHLSSSRGFEALTEPMIVRENDVYYVLPNSKKNKIEKEGKVRQVAIDETEGTEMNNLMVVHMDAYGRVTKSIVLEEKHVQFGSSFMVDGSSLLTLISNEKGRANVVKVKLP